VSARRSVQSASDAYARDVSVATRVAALKRRGAYTQAEASARAITLATGGRCRAVIGGGKAVVHDTTLIHGANAAIVYARAFRYRHATAGPTLIAHGRHLTRGTVRRERAAQDLRSVAADVEHAAARLTGCTRRRDVARLTGQSRANPDLATLRGRADGAPQAIAARVDEHAVLVRPALGLAHAARAARGKASRSAAFGSDASRSRATGDRRRATLRAAAAHPAGARDASARTAATGATARALRVAPARKRGTHRDASAQRAKSRAGHHADLYLARTAQAK